MSYPICPKRTGSDSPKFTKHLGEFDYVELGKGRAIQCCSDGVQEIKWYRQDGGQWNPFPPLPVPGVANQPSLEEQNQILRLNQAGFQDNTTFKCELIGSRPSDDTLQHELRLYVVACDKLAKGPVMTQPFPKDQYIDDFGVNVTLQCSGYFGCSDDGVIDGSADWLVKEKDRYRLAKKVSPRYNVTRSTSDSKTYLTAKLSISHVLEDDLARVFICKLSSAQIYESQSNQSVRIYKHKDPVNIELWVGIACGGVIVLVLVFVVVKAAIGKLWGPQIKWYFRSRIDFIGPKPALDEDLNYNAFMYHADDDIAVAHDIKAKLEEHNFLIFLSSDVQGNQAPMAAFQKESSASAVVIFLYTENLKADPMANFLLQCVVEYRHGKGILFLEVETYSAEEVKEWTEQAKAENENRGDQCREQSIEEDGSIHKMEDNEVSDKSNDHIDIKFWRALPRLKVPAENSSDRKKKNFHCSIQNRLPLIKSQLAQGQRKRPFKKSSDKSSRHSSCGKPLMSDCASPGAEMSPVSDEVFVYDNQAISRTASFPKTQENNGMICTANAGNRVREVQEQDNVNVDSQIEVGIPHPVRVSVDVHPQRDDGNILLNDNELEPQSEFAVINEIGNAERLKIDSLNSEETSSPSEKGVFNLSGEEIRNEPRNTDPYSTGQSIDNQSGRLESGFSEGDFNPRQTSAIEVNSDISPLSSNIDSHSMTEITDNHIPENTCQNQKKEIKIVTNLQPHASPGDRIESYGSGRESGYVTSPNTGSLGSSPGGSANSPFIKTKATAGIGMNKASVEV